MSSYKCVDQPLNGDLHAKSVFLWRKELPCRQGAECDHVLVNKCFFFVVLVSRPAPCYQGFAWISLDSSFYLDVFLYYRQTYRIQYAVGVGGSNSDVENEVISRYRDSLVIRRSTGGDGSDGDKSDAIGSKTISENSIFVAKWLHYQGNNAHTALSKRIS